jgi:CPA1 family monovalent cation:H+ antiporter
VPGAALSTALSFVVPFLAFLPAEELHASGLVAVVTAGLVTGAGSARHLSPQDRVSEFSNWQTVETLLEGGVFLVMGLELFGLIKDVTNDGESIRRAVMLAALAIGGVLVVRGAYLAPLLWSLAHRARRGVANREAVLRLQDRLEQRVAAAHPEGARPVKRAEWMRLEIARRLADIDYLAAKPLGPPEGVLLVWAGMRGVVTLAAAQSLPQGFPHRSFLVLVAFGVAAGSLLVQGGTLPWVVRHLGLAGAAPDDADELIALRTAAEEVARDMLDDETLARPGGTPYDAEVLARVRADVVKDRAALDAQALPRAERRAQYQELRLRVIEAQRARLLRERSEGAHDARVLERALDLLDAEQIMVELRTQR